MNLLICLLGPSLVGIKIFESLNGKLANKDMVVYYGIFTFLVNSITTLLCYILFNIKGDISAILQSDLIFALKYVGIAFLIVVIMAMLLDVIKKNIRFTFEVIKNEKKR